ncbi:MAG: triphosphoribosyl-dephospho-CoA synthase CitG [Desulfitobacteriaceae bacterium]|nr:triphosphoribosyl-dephospho-CoA synthase CitG [Desulfitobacteriaceae bacterium]MDD4401898.1 triphosphoribosyl-dephospho-CoA synthase CitG [Desulfitobacteriaceae bacterium]
MKNNYFNGEHIRLEEILHARENRSLRQQEMLKLYDYPLICMTLNIAGPVKRFPMADRTLAEGIKIIRASLTSRGIPVIDFRSCMEKTGCEAYFSLAAPADEIKKIMVGIEDNFPLGRLLDIDVLLKDGRKVERGDIGKAPRTCFLCSMPAAQCARNRTHSVEQLQHFTKKTMLEFFTEKFADNISRLAIRALLYEVSVTPKPGLVDRANKGAHKDMDFYSFIDSSLSLLPYFRSCVKLGLKHAKSADEDLFSLLRPQGILAEKQMFAVTGGVNTHKGAIFSLGLICAAIGRIEACGGQADEESVCCEVEKLAKYSLKDFELTDNKEHTINMAYVKHKFTGARGEAASGFHHVRKLALPELRYQLKLGKTLNDAGVFVLLRLISIIEDTNVVKRCDKQALEDIQHKAKKMLEQNITHMDEVERMDQLLIEKNISPGGCADLLAITYFFHFLLTESELQF